MNRIIPFHSDMTEAIIKGQKRATTRTKRYADPGDTFSVDYNGIKAICQVDSIRHITLKEVAFRYYLEEGFNDTAGFIEKWCQIHPIRRYDANQLVWLHLFKKERQFSNVRA